MAKNAKKSGKKPGKKSGKKPGKKPERPTKAALADRHALYQTTVQSPEADCEFFETVYRKLRAKAPLVLREDFCGTANLSCVWVEGGRKRRAIGVDLDGPTLDWGREHNLSRLGKKARERVELHQADVLDGPGEAADITCAMNFSYCVFKTRDLLRRYFEVARDKLAHDGIFVCELYGGTEAIIEITDEREYDEFDYEWEQEKYNPITAETLCHIHFRFDDGSRLDNAFTYDWRLWTLPEVRELLEEAGFSEVTVYWEGVDEDGDGTGEFHPTHEEENQESWLAYIVATK